MLYQVGVKTGADRRWVTNGVAYRTREHAAASARDLALRWSTILQHLSLLTLVRETTVLEVTESDARARRLAVYDAPTIKGAGHRVSL
jgi:hypothetical protein